MSRLAGNHFSAKKTTIMKPFLLVCLCICLMAPALSQESKRPLNSLFISVLGDASLISLNYDRLFPIRPGLMLSGKLGIGYNQEIRLCLFTPCSPPRYLMIPHHLNAVIGKGRFLFEAGLGGTLLRRNPAQPYVLYFQAGLRVMTFRPKTVCSRIFLQLPVSGYDTEGFFFLPLGAGLGVSL